MNRKRSLTLQAGLLAFIPLISTISPQAVEAQARRNVRRGAGPSDIPGEIVMYCQAGTAQADVNALATLVGATTTTPLLLADCYKLVLPDVKKDDPDTVAAIAVLKADKRVRWVGANRLFYSTQATTSTAPNDPLYTEQWHLNIINMPQAWVLQKGQTNINASVIDSGFDSAHEDLINQFLPDSYNFGDNNTNILPNGTGPEDQHGTHVSGTIAALTNNKLGVASICGWGGTKILGMKGFPTGTTGFPLSVLVNATTFAAQNVAKEHIVTLNMSLGGPGDPSDTSDPFYVSTLACVNAGIVVIVAAGNDNADNHQFTPAAFPFVLTVSAVGPGAVKSSYSSFGKVDIAAPGGEFGGTISDPDPNLAGDGSNGILSTYNKGYHWLQGTSMASPHACGVATLLLSVPGVTQKDVFDYNNKAASALLSTANHTITQQTTVPDQYFGYGLVDAYAALLKVSTSVAVNSPVGINPATGQSTDASGQTPQPVETLRPMMSFTVRNCPLSNVNIYLQTASGTNIPIITAGAVDPSATSLVTQFQVSGNSTGAFPQYTISFRYEFNFNVSSQQETVVISGAPADPTLPAVTNTVIFNVAPHQFNSGLSMVSIPYYESATDSPSRTQRSAQAILGLPTVALYRWVNLPVVNTNGASTVLGQYASNGTSADSNPALASLYPTDQATTTLPDINPLASSSSPTVVSPVGNGYFLNLPSGALVKTYGIALNQNIVRIPLHEGWNIVGDPFPFAVSFSNSEIETPDGNRQTVAEAVQANLVLPYIYSYAAGDYQLQQLPNGSYQPWQSHWIYIVPKNPASLSTASTLTLLVPPTPAASISSPRSVKSATTAGPAVNGAGSWSLRLTAHSGNLSDTYNYIGMSSNATDGNDLTKAPKPPKMSPYVTLGISRAAATGTTATGGLYAQDLRPIATTKSWDFVVNTDQKQADITVQWPNIAAVPRRYDLTLTDTVTGQTFDMRALPSYQFRATALEPTRKFTVTATVDSNAGRAVVSSLLVNPTRGRSAGSSIYEISYNVSRSANVAVSVLGANGRVISQVSPSRAATQGVNRAYWDGRDYAGRTVQSGTYVLEVRAQTPDGQVTREIQPMTLTGR